jgi:anti-sigma B factor antagonist
MSVRDSAERIRHRVSVARVPGRTGPVNGGTDKPGWETDSDRDGFGRQLAVVSDWPVPGTAVVRPSGEIDLLSASDLRHEVLCAIEDGARIVIVDLETTTFIDSMTIGILLGAVRRLRQRGGELRIACADPNIQRIFEITLLDRVFAMYPSCDAALQGPALSR